MVVEDFQKESGLEEHTVDASWVAEIDAEDLRTELEPGPDKDTVAFLVVEIVVA